jgi:undecaprenyl diphosphate synthase
MGKKTLEVNLNNIPKHVAIIMDGNGRWAKGKGQMRIFGHSNAIQAVRESAEIAAEIGVKYLTLYAFSTENWSRPQNEVNALMELLVKTINSETKTLLKNDIKLQAIGDINSLPLKTQKQLSKAINATANNKTMTLTLALSYSARWEILNAVKSIASKVKDGKLKIEDIDESIFNSELCTAEIPDPELLIRTSGEQRVSNYLLWQIAYSELYFTPKLWPDFRKEDFITALLDYQSRERRFGKTGEQIQNEVKAVNAD